MKLRDKRCDAAVFAYQPSVRLAFQVPVNQLLSPLQSKKAFQRPWTLIQVAHWMGDIYTANGTRPEIYVDCDCQVNYRPRQQYTDPTVDLGRADVWEWPTYSWIPEMEPLPEEAHAQFPWNWEWNFNWLRGIDANTRAELKAMRDADKEEVDERMELRRARFRAFIAEKYFDGSEKAVGELPSIPISSKRYTNKFALEILRRDGYMGETKSTKRKRRAEALEAIGDTVTDSVTDTVAEAGAERESKGESEVLHQREDDLNARQAPADDALEQLRAEAKLRLAEAAAAA
mmetsp:Transcript_12568/g.50279  ORF Transcript_12568/g.50279 Transcript_12568/m.50279 type:complete len:288 (+) Transcript_12568:91-954(+)